MFEFNGEAIQIFGEKSAHSDGDSIVFFRGSNVISAGDVFTTTGYPVIDLKRGGSIQGEINALNHIISLSVPHAMQEGGTMIIPGHGRLCDQSDVVDYRDMMTIIRDRVADLIEKRKNARRGEGRPTNSRLRPPLQHALVDWRYAYGGCIPEPESKMRLWTILVAALIVVSFGAPARLDAQAPPTPKAAAPIDLTGYWVALITEDWRIRMLTAPRGDYYSLPINDEARKVADAWDPAKDIAEGKQCMSYGAPGIMRVPGRLHITWDNDVTLKIETDAGRQTRVFSFGASRAPAGPATMQGVSVAQWMTPQATREYNSKISAQDSNTPGFPGIVNGAGPASPDTRNLGGRLKVMTTHLRPGISGTTACPTAPMPS